MKASVSSAIWAAPKPRPSAWTDSPAWPRWTASPIERHGSSELARHSADRCTRLAHPSARPAYDHLVEVTALIARVYTNRQIAEELIISERTADGHVADVLAKLGLKTRAQAAVWAVEHQLAPTRT